MGPSKGIIDRHFFSRATMEQALRCIDKAYPGNIEFLGVLSNYTAGRLHA